jgi:8-oxo-dGTP pyrophosphatase MutT (NUDIX family)
MLFRRFTCLFLSVVIGFQSIIPTLAMQTLEDLGQQGLKKHSSVPTNISFKAQPGRTGSGIFLYTLHQGKILFLLGERKESKQWCNPGGGSEESDGKEVFLFHTAVRETDEELDRFYCPHARLLKNQPFIDTYNGTLLYRMYWQQVQYLDEKILLEKRQGATAESQEFTDFTWVEASNLWQAVENQQPVIQVSPEKKIEIYPELFTTLSTLSGKAFLESLSTHYKIKRFDKNLRPFINQLYFVGSEAPLLIDLNPMPSLSWPAVIVDSVTEVAVLQELAVKNMYLSALPICSATEEGKSGYLVKRAAFLETKDSLAEVVFSPNAHQVIALDKEGDKSILAGAVAAHLGSMIELKHHFSQKNVAAKDEIVPKDSYTDMSLRIILGPDYKTSDHFQETLNPQDAADNENIKTYLDRYFGTNELGDGKRDVKVLPSDHSLIKSILQWERHKASPTFYNATSDTIYSLTLFFSHLRKYMMAAPLEGLPGFRGTDIYFKGIKTMVDAIERYGYRDYTPGESNGRSNLVLCGNATALAGLSTTCTTSFSIEYVMNNHSVRPPDLGSVIQEALALSGFDDPTNKYFHALFQQFIAHNHPEYANSVMFAIQLHPELLETYTYPAYGGGYPFTQKDEYTIQLLSANPTLDLLNGMSPRDIALYTKEYRLFCKILDQEEIEIPQEGTISLWKFLTGLKNLWQQTPLLNQKIEKPCLISCSQRSIPSQKKKDAPRLKFLKVCGQNIINKK